MKIPAFSPHLYVIVDSETTNPSLQHGVKFEMIVFVVSPECHGQVHALPRPKTPTLMKGITILLIFLPVSCHIPACSSLTIRLLYLFHSIHIIRTSIRETPGSNLSRNTDYSERFCEFDQSLMENAGIVPKIRLRPIAPSSHKIKYSSFCFQCI
jgi:hypothetical protein